MATSRMLHIHDGTRYIDARFKSDQDAEDFKRMLRDTGAKALHWHDCLERLLEACDEPTYPEPTDTERALVNIAALRAVVDTLAPGITPDEAVRRLAAVREAYAAWDNGTTPHYWEVFDAVGSLFAPVAAEGGGDGTPG